jgi:hypothetical protein
MASWNELRERLNRHTNDELKTLVSIAGAPSKPTRKPERIEVLVQLLTNPGEVKRLWEKMDPLSQKALAAAYHNGGVFHADAFANQYGALPERPGITTKYGGYSYGSGDWMILDLFFAHESSYYKQLNGLSIHPEIMPLLEPLMPEPDRFRLEGQAKLPEGLEIWKDYPPAPIVTVETEETGRRDLLLFLALLDQQAIRLNSQKTQLTPKGVEVLSSKLNISDTDTETHSAQKAIRAYGLTTFAMASGLVSRGNLSKLGREYLTTEDPELLLEAFHQWTESDDVDEIFRIDAIKGFRARGTKLTRPSTRRERIIEALSWAPVGEWIAVLELFRAIKIWHLDFDVEEGRTENLYVGYRYERYQSWSTPRDMWLLINGLYIQVVLWEYLSTIGAIDIAWVDAEESVFPADTHYGYDEDFYSAYDNLLAFRITPLGAYLFGQAGEYALPTVASAPLFQVQADGLIRLQKGAEITQAHRGLLEQVARPEEGDYRLDRDRMLLLLESAPNFAQPLAFLEQRNKGPLPQETLDLFRQVEEDSHAFKVTSTMVRVRVRSAELAEAVMKDGAVSKTAQRYDSRTLLIPENKKTTLRNALRALGYGLKE